MRQDWTRLKIKGALMLRGLTLKSISIAAGYHHSAGSKACKQPWPQVEKVIAAAIDEKPEDIWPSRYPSHDSAACGDPQP